MLFLIIYIGVPLTAIGLCIWVVALRDAAGHQEWSLIKRCVWFMFILITFLIGASVYYLYIKKRKLAAWSFVCLLSANYIIGYFVFLPIYTKMFYQGLTAVELHASDKSNDNFGFAGINVYPEKMFVYTGVTNIRDYIDIAGHIHIGRSEQHGAVLQTLGKFGKGTFFKSKWRRYSNTTLRANFTELMQQGSFSVDIHASDGQIIACGDVPNTPLRK